MNDRENVIEHLKEIAEYFRGCRSNASFASKAENHFWELQNAASEAAELLKAQEPVIPKPIHASERWYACGDCDCSISKGDDTYCPRCGRKVKWE